MANDLTVTPTDLHWLKIADAAQLIERRRLSPVELTYADRPRRGARPALSVFLVLDLDRLAVDHLGGFALQPK